MFIADETLLDWITCLWNATAIGIALGVLGIAATFASVLWFEYKSRLQKDIEVLLRKCRESTDWDDKSELKLIQWMLDTPEDQIHNCGLFRVRRIRNSLNDFLYIHRYGRAPVPPAGPIESLLQSLADRLRYRRESRVRVKKKTRRAMSNRPSRR